MSAQPTAAPGLAPIPLPRPDGARGGDLAVAFERRETIRTFDDRKLPPPVLSGLLWSAWGINRAAGPFGLPGRTAASASNSQEIDLYVLLEEGAYLYEPSEHRLLPVAAGDRRVDAMNPGQRGLGSRAPVQLIYVVDLDRLTHTKGFAEPGLRDPEVQKAYYYVDTGLIAGNVYLFAAAHGLAAWFHNCDKPHLAQDLGLGARQRALFAQSVGYPARS
ncbi:MAG TPA: nitroreductase family protein [Dongiaceae bacterium]|nr:nitroreductase family protein [Dongiaceae bacterium]